MDKITVLFPGGFKPLTGAHMDLAERYAAEPNVDRVIMLISGKDRNGITRNNSMQIFDILNHDAEISIIEMQPTEVPSPITAAYEYLFALPPDTVGRYALAASAKGDDYVRTTTFGSSVETYKKVGDKNGRKIPAGVNAEMLNINVEPLIASTGEPISATTLRNAIATQDYELFATGYPNTDSDKINQIWTILTGLTELAESVFTTNWWKQVFEGALKSTSVKNKAKLLTEGGAAGHMQHPWDSHDLTFGDMKEIVRRGLVGELNIEEAVTEKTDGQNIQVTWKNGQIGFARNKGTVVNPMTTAELQAKFDNRGPISEAFGNAGEDLTEAFSRVPQDQLNQVFKNGRVFANMEIIYPATRNVIAYEVAVLQFHNLVEYDDVGNIIETDAAGGALIQRVVTEANKDLQKKDTSGNPIYGSGFQIIPPQQIKLGRVDNFKDQEAALNNEIDQLRNTYGLQDTDLVTDYHKAWWANIIKQKAQELSYELPEQVLNVLIYRWAFFNKETSLKVLKKMITSPEFLAWVLEMDNGEFKRLYKENMEPFESIFLRLGVIVLQNAQNFLAMNPSEAVQQIKSELAELIRELQQSDDVKTLAKLKIELQRIEKLGGFNAIVPSEGVVFVYRGQTFKLTGAFAPVNQILGVLKYSR